MRPGSARGACTVLLALVVVGAGTMAGTGCDTRSRSGRGALVVLDAETGDERWRARPRRGRFYEAAAIGSGLVVATDYECPYRDRSGGRPAVAFDARTGERLWTNRDTGGVDVAARGVVVAQGSGVSSPARSFDAKTGDELWELPDERRLLGVSETLVFTAARGSDRLRAHDRLTGKRRWELGSLATVGPGVGRTLSVSVAAADRRRVIVANGGHLGRSGDQPFGPTTFFVLDARTGEERGRFTVADPTFDSSDFALAGDLFAHAEGTSLVARQLPTGAIRWQRTIPLGTPLQADDDFPVRMLQAADGRTLLALGSDNSVAAFDTASGTQLWAERDLVPYAAGSGTTVARRPTSDRIWAVTTRTGGPRWVRDVPSGIRPDRYSGGAEETIYTALADGTIALNGACELG